jgi:hypothetical protein
MGGAFDTEEEHNKRTTQAQRLGKNPINENEDFFCIYFDGRLEEMIGFDIVCFIDGTMPKIKYGDIIDCTVITPDDKEHDAIIIVCKSKMRKELFCLVRLPIDVLMDTGEDLEVNKLALTKYDENRFNEHRANSQTDDGSWVGR